MDQSTKRQCASPSCTKTQTSRCGGCKVTRYCSLECQSSHRSIHKVFCKDAIEQRARADQITQLIALPKSSWDAVVSEISTKGKADILDKFGNSDLVLKAEDGIIYEKATSRQLICIDTLTIPDTAEVSFYTKLVLAYGEPIHTISNKVQIFSVLIGTNTNREGLFYYPDSHSFVIIPATERGDEIILSIPSGDIKIPKIMFNGVICKKPFVYDGLSFH